MVYIKLAKRLFCGVKAHEQLHHHQGMLGNQTRNLIGCVQVAFMAHMQSHLFLTVILVGDVG